MFKIVIGAFVALVVLTSCSQDDSESANRLFVEAVSLISSADGAAAEGKVRLLEEAQVTLETIITGYPTTDLAVELASGQAIGEVSLSTIASRLSDARVDLCQLSPSVACISDWLADSASEVENFENEWQRWFVLSEIVGIKAHEGDFSDALAILDTIKDDDAREWAISLIAAGQAIHSLDSDALQSAGLLGDNYRIWTMLDIAKVQARDARDSDFANTLSLAMASVQDMVDHLGRARALVGIADVQHLAGRRSEAVETLSRAMEEAEAINEPDARAQVFSSIAETQTELGLDADAMQTLAKAIEVAVEIEDVDAHVRRMSFIAGAQRALGSGAGAAQTLSRAIEVAELIEDIEDRVRHLATIAEIQSELGFVREATQTIFMAQQDLDSMEEGAFRDFSLERIAKAQAKTGAYSDALDTIRSTRLHSFGIGRHEASVLAIIAGRQAEENLYSEALQTARGIVEPSEQVTAFVNIARAYLELGLEDEANRAIARAREISESIDSIYLRLSGMADFAEFQFKMGNTDHALKTIAEGIQVAEIADNPSDQLRGLSSFVMALSCAIKENCE